MSDKIELLPCPFCGGTHTELQAADQLAATSWSASVACLICQISVASSYCDGSPEDAEGSAIAAWNRRAALAQQPAPAVPDGYRLVPVEPTEGMLEVGLDRHRPQTMSSARLALLYRAMLSAAPAAPVVVHDHSEAEQCLFVLREIASMDADDIDGDNIDLRFEDAEGRDTGCDVSIVEYAQRAADVIEGLIAAPAAPVAQEPCGGCGATDESQRCIGCMHQFAQPAAEQKLVVYRCPRCGTNTEPPAAWSAQVLCDACGEASAASAARAAAEQPDTVKVPRELLQEAVEEIESLVVLVEEDRGVGRHIERMRAAFAPELRVAMKLRALLAGGEA